jgi:hypothetical protein
LSTTHTPYFLSFPFYFCFQPMCRVRSEAPN